MSKTTKIIIAVAAIAVIAYAFYAYKKKKADATIINMAPGAAPAKAA